MTTQHLCSNLIIFQCRTARRRLSRRRRRCGRNQAVRGVGRVRSSNMVGGFRFRRSTITLQNPTADGRLWRLLVGSVDAAQTRQKLGRIRWRTVVAADRRCRAAVAEYAAACAVVRRGVIAIVGRLQIFGRMVDRLA